MSLTQNATHRARILAELTGALPQAHARAARRATRPPAGAVLVRALRRQALPVQKLARPSEACLRPAAVHGVRDHRRTHSTFLDLDFAALVDSKPCACLKVVSRTHVCFHSQGGRGEITSTVASPRVHATCTSYKHARAHAHSFMHVRCGRRATCLSASALRSFRRPTPSCCRPRRSPPWWRGQRCAACM